VSGYDSKNEEFTCKDCNVILISINVLRADNLGAYGYGRNTSPNIDRLASGGVLFRNAFAQTSYTNASVLSMFTSLYPLTHGVIIAGEDTLSASTPTFTEILKQNDYTTASFAYLEGDLNLDPQNGVGRNFDETYQDLRHPNDWSEVYTWVRENRQKNFFLFLHTYILHDPYITPSPFDKLYDSDYEGNIIGEATDFLSKFTETQATDWELDIIRDFLSLRNFFWQFVDTSDENDVKHLIALYDAELTCCIDPFIGKLMDTLGKYGLDEKTIVIFTSDHGEAFGEHGSFLHNELHYEELHIPLIFAIPNAAQRTIDSQVQNIDIMPTMLDILGIPTPDGAQGKSLMPLIRGETKSINEYTYGYWINMSSIRSEKWKLIRHATGELELYDVEHDPTEQANVIEEYPDIAEDMAKKLEEFEFSSYTSRSQ